MKKTTIYVALFVIAAGLISACNSENKNAKTSDSSKVGTNAKMGSAKFNVGTFTGEIPSGSAKANVTITFNSDSTFTLKEGYLTKDGKPEHEANNAGTWKQDTSAKKVYLVYKNLMDRGTSFELIDDNTIQMKETGMGAKGNSGSEYNLKRK